MARVRLSSVATALDAPDSVARMGMIALSTDLTTERDAARVIPAGQAALHTTRVAFENPTTPDNLRRMLPRLTDAADLLVPEVPLAAIYFACTAASVAIGDAAVAEAIHAVRPGVPVVTPGAAALAGFRELGMSRVALLTPYLVETTDPMVDYFTGQGLRIVAAECLGLEDDRDMARVSSETILAAAEAADRPEAEALFVSCTALPALSVIDRIESRLGKPVISSNQAGLWQMLRHAGIAPAPGAPGRLFRQRVAA